MSTDNAPRLNDILPGIEDIEIDPERDRLLIGYSDQDDARVLEFFRGLDEDELEMFHHYVHFAPIPIGVVIHLSEMVEGYAEQDPRRSFKHAQETVLEELDRLIKYCDFMAEQEFVPAIERELDDDIGEDSAVINGWLIIDIRDLQGEFVDLKDLIEMYRQRTLDPNTTEVLDENVLTGIVMYGVPIGDVTNPEADLESIFDSITPL